MNLILAPRNCCALLGVVALLLFPTLSSADVVKAGPDGFRIKITTIVNSDCEIAYETFVNDFSSWWDASHSYTGKAENLSLDLERHCMLERLPEEGFVRHMEVVFHQPGKMLRMTGGLGPLQEMGVAGSLTFAFEKAEAGTQVVVSYNVSGAAHQNLEAIASPVDGVLASQLARFEDYCNERTESKKHSVSHSGSPNQEPATNDGQQNVDSFSDAEKAAEILKHDIGEWDCTWEYLDAEGEVSRTVTGLESMKASLDGKIIEMETFVPEGELASKSLRFYNATTNKLTLLSVGADGNHWELNQEVDSNVMVSKPHPTRTGGQQWIRFTTIESTEDRMRVMMEISRDGKEWRKVFYQTLVRRK